MLNDEIRRKKINLKNEPKEKKKAIKRMRIKFNIKIK
jgi:hypothetical protein